MFLLTLNRQKMTQRIIIGESSEIRLRLERGMGEVPYDETCRIGEFLINFESDPDRIWNINATHLADNFAGAFPTKNVKSDKIKPYADFLRNKYKNGEPSALFAAVRTWEDYWKCYSAHNGSDIFLNRMAKLYKPFFAFGEQQKIWETTATKALSSALFAAESQVELWYPTITTGTTRKRTDERIECVVGATTLLPIIFYYLKRIEEWGLIFQQCKVCGAYFLTTSKHFKLCGDDCRKVTAAQSKRVFEEQNKGDKAEQLYETTYQYWYNRLRKLKRNNTDGKFEKEIADFSAKFKEFRAEAVKRKAAVKAGDTEVKEYMGWLGEQQRIVEGMVKRGHG